ncbi:MAG TPA: hypothetical protein VJP59_03515 [Gemmatimonadota bacterium]|nr:hypothetical protein [Gemmatimonadota bacterium]
MNVLESRATILSFLIFLAGPKAVHAQAEGHQILFPDSTTTSEDDQRAIFDLLGYTLSADGTALEAPDCGTIFSQVEETDLNGDGVSEVFVLAGNTCTSGMAGSSIVLFIKDAEGRYGSHLGFPAGGWTKLETSNAGFPDLAIGGPGFCEAVWRWDGTTYQHDHDRETEPGGCDGVG